MTPAAEGNSNIVVEITDPSEHHCFRLVLNPDGDRCVRCGAPYLPTGQCSALLCQGGRGENPGQSRVEIMFHARSLVDLIHKCNVALTDWQKDRTDYLLGLLERESAAGERSL